MNSNLFQEIQNKRDNFKIYAEKALENNWICQDQLNEIIYKIENDKLVIGVIGQMKAGKSTFLNALIFKDEILPAATTPMTASLSIVTYGPEKKLLVEFYSRGEWDDLKQFASLDVKNYESDGNQQSKIKAAIEIVSKSAKIIAEIDNLLGTERVDKFENLIEYVGADGKYISITKAVRIEYPLEYLKGVEIVDTPGFNDPVVSREERTKEFLGKADAVVMLLYAGRAFDSTDKDIIFNKLGSIGMGKILIGINKYDINYAQGENPQAMVEYVKQQLLEVGAEYDNNSIVSLVGEQDPLLLSANMALMSQLDLARINSDPNLQFYYQNALDYFEITNQKEMYNKSLMPAFEQAIKNIIFKSKEEILIKKPVNLIKQIGVSKTVDLVSKQTKYQNELIVLNTPDNELDELLHNATRAKKRLNKKIDGLEIDVIEKLKKGNKKLHNETIDSIESVRKKCNEIIDGKFVILKRDSVNNELLDKFRFLERDLQKIFEKNNDEINNSIARLTNDFIFEIEEISEKFLEEFDSADYLRTFKQNFFNNIININPKHLLPVMDSNDDDVGFLDGMFSLLNKTTLGLIPGVANLFSGKRDGREFVNSFFSLIDTDIVQQVVFENGSILIDNIKKNLTDDFINPIINSAEKMHTNKANRLNEIKEVKSKLDIVSQDLNSVNVQVSEMKILELNI